MGRPERASKCSQEQINPDKVLLRALRAFLYGCAITLFIIMLGGCASSTKEMYTAARACDQANPDDSATCQPLWDDWNRAEKRKLKRQENGCPPRHVKWITNSGVTCVPDAASKDAIDKLTRRY